MTGYAESRVNPDGVTKEEVDRMLKKPTDEVYSYSSDGSTYTSPRCLISTPVRKIAENDEYWKPTWLSLESFLAQENEKKAKAEAHELIRLDPLNKRVAETYKIHSDNVSKYKKIREIFGKDTPYHPNQLVSKHHLPLEGLCSKDLMYKLACKISDLQCLRDRGELAMDPFDFIRWRVGLKLHPKLSYKTPSGREFVKTIISQIFEGAGTTTTPRPYHDPLLRAAIMRSAGYQGRLNSYGKHEDKRKVVRKGPTATSRVKTESTATLARVPAYPLSS